MIQRIRTVAVNMFSGNIVRQIQQAELLPKFTIFELLRKTDLQVNFTYALEIGNLQRIKM